MKNGKSYEMLVARIYRELSPYAEIKEDDRIIGHKTGGKRQIDISIRAKVVFHDILTIVQVKDLKKPADINIVGEFAKVIEDVRASKGILVCSRGFTKRAIEYAKKEAIDLCTAHDAENRDWTLDLKIPFMVVHIDKSFAFQIRAMRSKEMVQKAVSVDSVMENLIDVPMSCDGGKTTFTFMDLISRKESSGEFSNKSGTTSHDLHQEGIALLVEGIWVPLAVFKVKYMVTKRGKLKYLDADGYRAITDIATGETHISYLKFRTPDFLNTLDNTWADVNPDEIAITPISLTVEFGAHTTRKSLQQTKVEVSKFYGTEGEPKP